MQSNVYLTFEGRTEEALEFYKKTLGITVEMMMRFKDAPQEAQGGCAPGTENKIMHSSFRLGNQLVMASDGRCQGSANFHGFALTLSTQDEAELDKVFAALGEGGQVQMPPTKTFFSPKFGMVQDKFGLGWMVMVEPKG
jgi:PhnB protein